ncbi:MAG TPA: hypothetical protein EYP60_08415 [bacterium (Candidatus Stahlbacteria)]|nr:hypothetical protein [Candidatus Stahlbacteria bacterium]
MKKLDFILFISLLLPVSLHADSRNPTTYTATKLMQGRPKDEYKVHTIGRLWSAVGNWGGYGDPNTVIPSYDWPGGTRMFYLWEGMIWLGTTIGETKYVSHCEYGNYELWPSVDGQWDIKKPGISMHDIGCKFDDWYDARNDKARQLGIKVIQTAMQWSVPGFDDFIAYQQRITYEKDSSFHKSDTLRDLYISIVFNTRVAGAIVPRGNIDNLTSYDGWTNGEWTKTWYPPDRTKEGEIVRGGETVEYPYDFVTIYPPKEGYPYGVPTDTTGSDGILDQMIVFGDEPSEHTVHGDTLIFWRNLCYTYDGDNPTRPGDDEAEWGMVPGFIGATVLYAPPSSNDSVWIDKYGDTCRMIRPYSHQWWNWANDPGTDEDKMLYTLGKHPFSRNKRFMAHPFDWGAPVFDYRFMLNYGPYKIGAGDTIDFVCVGFVGFGLNGGYGYGKGADEGIFEKDKWYPGVRWIVDQAIKAYYMGSMNSDPLHPSSPSEDVHWLIPIPPEVPYLEYSAGKGVVTLAWTDIAERTPDPIDGMYDFAGYRIYRAEFRPGTWVFLKGFVDSAFAEENADQFPKDKYGWINREVGETFPHSYVDSFVIYGIPYLYAVTSFDAGRKGPPPMPSLESGKVNYKKTELGAEIPVFVKTERSHGKRPAPTLADLDKITVAPNPYIGSARWERKHENRIQFMNLPGTCRIHIYTVSGDLIKEIEHTDGTGDEYWNLLSRNNQEVVSGLYVYKVEAWNAEGKPIYKIGKFIILR